MSEGYIKIHRKIEDSVVWQDENPATIKVWLHCLISATYMDRNVKRGENEVNIPAGCFLYSRTTWSKKLRIRPGTLRNIMERLHFWDMIEDYQRDKGIATIYKIKNWNKYQQEDILKDTKEDNYRTTTGQLEDIYNNERKKERKNHHDSDFTKNYFLTEQQIGLLAEEFPGVDLPSAYRHLRERIDSPIAEPMSYTRSCIKQMIKDGTYPKKRKSYLFKVGDREFQSTEEYTEYMQAVK